MFSNEKSQKQWFYHFWEYDHKQEGYDYDVTTNEFFDQMNIFIQKNC